MDFTPELDGFLEQLVEEQGQNWDAIEEEFLEIAADFEETDLREAARAQFTRSKLESRWRQLSSSRGGGGGSGNDHGGPASIAPDAAGNQDGPTSGRPANTEPEVAGSSAASVLTGTDEAPRDVGSSADDASTTADEMSATGDDGQLGISSSAQIREEAMQRLAATTRPGESEFNPNFPSFAVALLAHGVNPHDIEGDIVENQADRPEVFDSILKNLQSGHDYSAMTTNVSREEFSTLLNGPNALRTRSKDGGGGGAVSSTSTSASSRPAPASRGGVSALQRNRSQSAAGQKGKGKATGSKGVGGISSGSDSEEDFAKARAKVKQHSESKLVGGSSLSTSSSTTTMRPTSGGFRPPARSTASNILQQEQAKHKESPEKVDQVGQEGKDEQNEEEEDHQDADDTTAQPEDRLKKQQPLMRSNRRSAFSKLSKEEELLIAGGFGAGFIDEYDHTDDLSEGAKKKVAEIEAFLKRGKPDQPSMQQLQKAIAEDKALMSQVTKAKNVGKASLENDENGNASTDQPERLLPREEPRGDVLRDISSAVANRTPSISPEPVQKVNSGSAVDKASLLNADRVIEAGGDGAGTIQRNVVESSGDAQALLANLKKFRNGREENTDPAERRASLSKEEQRRQDEDEKRRFAEECERRRVMLQERMRGLDQVLATSDRVHEHVANLQRLESSSRDQVLVLKGTRTGGSPRMLSSKTGSPKVNKSSPKRASFLDYADSYDRDATASTAASTRAQGTDATEETERKGGSSSSQEEVGETIEVDTKLLEEVAGRRYNFPLVHFAGSRSQQLDLAPAGFVSMAMGMNTKLYLLPYASEERPLPSEKTLQILSAVAVCQAAVLLLVDGVSLQNAESASSRRSDMQYYGLYVLIAAPERKVLRQLQDEASRVEIDEAPKQGIRPRAPDFAKEADKLQEAPFLPIEADDWHPVLTRSFGFGPHLVGSYAKEEEFSDDEKLDRHYTATDGALTKGGFYEQACVVVVRKPDLLGELVRQGTQRGLYLCGLRTVYPSASEIEKCCSILKQHLRASQRNVIAALRGPDCLEILREIVGPSPEIARQTDPTSLNARFGGIHSTHVVSPPARGQVDLVWAFGGRAQDIQPKEPLGRQDMAAHLKTALRNTAVTHAFHVFPEQVYCVALRHALAPKDLVTRLGLFLRHFGRVLSVNPQRVKLEGMGSLSTFTVTAVREAGTGFLQPLRQQSGSLYEHVFSELPMETYGLRVRNLDQNHAFSAPPRTEDQVDVCVTLLPLLPGDDLSAVWQLLESEGADHKAGEPRSLTFGAGLDLIALRVLDMSQVSLSSTTEYHLRSPLLSEQARKGLVLFAVYRGENCFARVESYILRQSRAPFAGAQGRWKFTRTTAESFHYYTAFFGLKSFWSAPGGSAAAGTANLLSSGLLPSFPLGDLRCHDRYAMTRERYERRRRRFGGSSPSAHSPSTKSSSSSPMQRKTSNISEDQLLATVAMQPEALFYLSSENEEVAELSPGSRGQKGTGTGSRSSYTSTLGTSPKEPCLVRWTPEDLTSAKFGKNVTFALVARPFLRRTLGILKQNRFELRNCVTVASAESSASSSSSSGEESSLFSRVKRLFWDQDTKDGFLRESDKENFLESAWADEQYLLQLHREHNACKRLVQLCGHGDPAENAKNSYVSLRKGKNRARSGVLCTSSAESAKMMAQILTADPTDSDDPEPRKSSLSKTNPLRAYVGSKSVDGLCAVLDAVSEVPSLAVAVNEEDGYIARLGLREESIIRELSKDFDSKPKDDAVEITAALRAEERHDWDRLFVGILF